MLYHVENVDCCLCAGLNLHIRLCRSYLFSRFLLAVITVHVNKVLGTAEYDAHGSICSLTCMHQVIKDKMHKELKHII